MTANAKQIDAQQAAERPNRRSDEALMEAAVGSSPDLAHGFLRVTEGMTNSGSPLKVIMGGSLMGQLLFFTIGLQSMVGAALLWDKVNEGRKDSRSYELEMFKIQSDIELKKMDRTMLGDGAMKTLSSIADKLDAQGTAVAVQGQKLDKVMANVDALTKRQNSLAADQQEMRKRIEQPPQRSVR